MINAITSEIRDLAVRIGRPVKLMEVCGTHTMAAFRTALRSLLPPDVSLISGPGCPVCVTPNSYLDRAIALARLPGTIVATFGDMIRVPGTDSSLERERASGADVRIVYSPLDAIAAAKKDPSRRVVFLGVGFETTTPAVAWTLQEARRAGVANYSVLCGHKTIPEAMAGLLAGGDIGIDGFMCPGHVSVITGSRVYEGICREYRVPCVVAGFEAVDMATAIRMLLRQIAEGRAAVEIEYTRSVTPAGNAAAQQACNAVFEKADAEWRGLGVIPASGLRVRETYSDHDAEKVYRGRMDIGDSLKKRKKDSGCRCGDVLRGMIPPSECPLFGKRCTPEQPAGPCMVSSEGSCSAHYRYGRTP